MMEDEIVVVTGQESRPGTTNQGEVGGEGGDWKGKNYWYGNNHHNKQQRLQLRGGVRGRFPVRRICAQAGVVV